MDSCFGHGRVRPPKNKNKYIAFSIPNNGDASFVVSPHAAEAAAESTPAPPPVAAASGEGVAMLAGTAAAAAVSVSIEKPTKMNKGKM